MDRKEACQHNPPLVSVVTPFYNTAAYLRECIESVASQTWTHFEYILQDNQSDDGSRDIALEYAARDSRIRYVTTPRHMGQLENFNLALRQISTRSRYVKMVLGDDWLLPQCLERMVEVAEQHASIGIVSSYYLAGSDVRNVGLPYGPGLFPGREVCRRQLLDPVFFFGSPSNVLYRADIVRAENDFFDVAALHADTETAYRILRKHDFGFVHQVLSYMRVGNDSISTRVADLCPHYLDRLIVLHKYGHDFLELEEYKKCLRGMERDYYRNFLHAVCRRSGARFARYHCTALERVGYRLSKRRMLVAGLAEAANVLLNPGRTIGRVALKLGLGKRRA